MKQFLLLLLLCLPVLPASAQHKKTEVLTLGVFHFNFPNQDVAQTSQRDQIDVLQERYQAEIRTLVEKLAKFKPTVIVIERSPDMQHRTDSLFAAYCHGRYQLKKNEAEQIGFRLAKKLGLKKQYCADEWGDFVPKADSIVFQKDTVGYNQFIAYHGNNPDKGKYYRPEPVFKTKGILAELRRLNNPAHIRNSLGNYLIGPFKFEKTEGDFAGVHFETGRWFNRNLKIFRNIQRISTTPEDRILVIFGADHLNVLNLLFESSPEYKLANTEKYLR